MVAAVEEYARLPGAEVIAAGLRDLAAGAETVPALAVLMTATRLRALGIEVPDAEVQRPSHRLYELLAREDSRTAHGRYNALVRRIVSFARAAEHARER
jgi:hypothetical protein